jgi:hypothetical protein
LDNRPALRFAEPVAVTLDEDVWRGVAEEEVEDRSGRDLIAEDGAQ